MKFNIFHFLDTISIIRYTNFRISITGREIMAVKVSKKGGIIIPKAMRQRHNIRSGDMVEFVDLSGNITIVRLPKDPLTAARGLLKGGPSMKEYLEEKHRELAEEERDLPPPHGQAEN
jgi:AbrB family looped-hinge helix DNA binding protein